MQQAAPTSKRSICHEVQQQVTSVCVTGTGSPGLSSGCTQPVMGGSGCIRLPSNCHIGQGGGEVAGLPWQENHSDCSRMAQHALILGSSGHVQPDPSESAQPAKPANTALQSDPSQKSDKSKSSWLLEPQNQGAGLLWGSGSTNWGSSERTNQISFWGKVDHFYKVVHQQSGGLQGTPYIFNGWLPVPGQEVTAQYH